MAESIKKIFYNTLKAGGVTVLLFLLGIVIGYFWTKYSHKSVIKYAPWIQLSSGAFILWSVLGKLGWEIQTWKGESPAEKWNKWIFRVLNCIGMFFLFISSSALLFAGR